MPGRFKFLTRAALAAAFLLLLAPVQTVAPASTPAGQAIDRTKTLILDIDGGRDLTPDIWNPYLPSRRLDVGYHQSILEPLFILNYETGQIQGWVGESMTPNATQDAWTLKLRNGVTWSDGVPYTADDVVFSIQMLLSHAPDLIGSSDMKDWVASVSKVDDQTVQFALNKPNPRFQLDYFSVRIWGGINIVPKHIWDGQDPLTFKNYDPDKGWPVGSGAYKLASIGPTEFTYVRDDNWWAAKTGFAQLPEPQKLIWTWAGPEETRAALMADGGLDSMMDITLGTFKAIQARNPNVIAWYPQLPYAWLDPCARNLEFNTAVAPWDDKDMRWAVNFALDRNQIVAIAYEGTTLPSKFFFPAYGPLNKYVDAADEAGLYNKYPLLTHDPDRAKQIIESKGYTMGGDGYYQKNGQQLGLTITAGDTATEHQRIIQVEVEQLQAVGINAVQRNEAEAVWNENRDFGRFEARQGWDACDSVNEPWASMDRFNAKWAVPVGERSPSSKNIWRWKNSEYSAIVDQMGTLPLGDPKLQDLFLQATDIYLNELPDIPITQAKKLIPFDSTHWSGWPTHDKNLIQATTWWQMFPVILQNLHSTGR
ncbi:MAG: ABC transporter substrate-binding protein [Chloroflexi bacterium]|nr:MAG: ABC transporter substrate-binding protein [Chloroflexota bacterium]